MKANPKFTNQSSRFWATVKIVSERAGYSERGKKREPVKMKRYDFSDIVKTFTTLGLPNDYCIKDGKPTPECALVLEYLNYRADLLENTVQTFLMDKTEAQTAYEELKSKFPLSTVKAQMNKQTGDKSHPNYLVNIINLIAESILGNDFQDDPHSMAIVSDGKGPIKMLCRRMDGAYPSLIEPKIMWEVKEYYGTKTFGSRIADGVYETMLVGEELKELKKDYGIDIISVLFVDDKFSWWTLGRSYLCRLIDILHSGHVDYIFFGKEALTEWGVLLQEVKSATK